MAVRSRSCCTDRAVRFASLTLLGVFALVLPGCGGDGSGAPPPPVQEVARQLARGGAESVIVLVSDDGREYVASAGDSATEHRPAVSGRECDEDVHRDNRASARRRGKLRLSDPLERHLPGVVPAGKKITIRQLLNHRSGLANFTDYAGWLRGQADRPRSDRLTPCASQPRSHSSSRPAANGGIQTPTTSPSASSSRRSPEIRIGKSLSRRILDPLALKRTELPRTRRLRDLDDEGENPNIPWAAGALVSDAHDLARFFSALLSGRLLSEGSLAQMKQTVVVDHEVGYGLGIFSEPAHVRAFLGS